MSDAPDRIDPDAMRFVVANTWEPRPHHRPNLNPEPDEVERVADAYLGPAQPLIEGGQGRTRDEVAAAAWIAAIAVACLVGLAVLGWLL